MPNESGVLWGPVCVLNDEEIEICFLWWVGIVGFFLFYFFFGGGGFGFVNTFGVAYKVIVESFVFQKRNNKNLNLSCCLSLSDQRWHHWWSPPGDCEWPPSCCITTEITHGNKRLHIFRIIMDLSTETRGTCKIYLYKSMIAWISQYSW